MAEAEAPTENYRAGEALPAARVEDLLEAMAVPGLGPVTLRRLLRHFNSWERARRASRGELSELGLKGETVRALRTRDLRYDPAKELKKARDLGIRILPFSAPEFPRALRDGDGLPLLLYVKGDFQERDALAIGIVGSRRRRSTAGCTRSGWRSSWRRRNSRWSAAWRRAWTRRRTRAR